MLHAGLLQPQEGYKPPDDETDVNIEQATWGSPVHLTPQLLHSCGCVQLLKLYYCRIIS